MRSEQLDPVGEDLDAGTGVVLFDRFEAPAHASFDRHPPPDPQVVLADRGLAFVGDDVEEVRLFVVGSGDGKSERAARSAGRAVS